MLRMKSIASGVYPTMIVPYTEQNKLDFEAVRLLVDYYARSGWCCFLQTVTAVL